jgi:hypothetical protein
LRSVFIAIFKDPEAAPFDCSSTISVSGIVASADLPTAKQVDGEFPIASADTVTELTESGLVFVEGSPSSQTHPPVISPPRTFRSVPTVFVPTTLGKTTLVGVIVGYELGGRTWTDRDLTTGVSPSPDSVVI